MYNNYFMEKTIKNTWSPTSWKEKTVKQLPTYSNSELLEENYSQLKGLPPLVTSWEIEALKAKLAEVSAGKSFYFRVATVLKVSIS